MVNLQSVTHLPTTSISPHDKLTLDVYIGKRKKFLCSLVATQVHYDSDTEGAAPSYKVLFPAAGTCVSTKFGTKKGLYKPKYIAIRLSIGKRVYNKWKFDLSQCINMPCRLLNVASKTIPKEESSHANVPLMLKVCISPSAR